MKYMITLGYTWFVCQSFDQTNGAAFILRLRANFNANHPWPNAKDNLKRLKDSNNAAFIPLSDKINDIIIWKRKLKVFSKKILPSDFGLDSSNIKSR